MGKVAMGRQLCKALTVLVCLSALVAYGGQRELVRRQQDVEAILRVPDEILASMKRLEKTGPAPGNDARLLGTWKNREGYSIPNLTVTFSSDGIARQISAEQDYRVWYRTIRRDGIDWLIQINKTPHYTGRSIQAYLIDDETLYMRFIRFDADWEVWQREASPPNHAPQTRP